VRALRAGWLERIVATYDESEPIKNAEDLRSVLRKAELGAADLKIASAEDVIALLHMVDAIEAAIPRLEGELGVDLKPERTRLETLENVIRSRISLAVRRAGASRLELERERVNPTTDEWWWHLDLIVAAQRRRRLRRLATYGLAAAAVLLIATLAYNMFLAPSPEEQALAQTVSDGENYLMTGDLEAARKEFEAAVALSPDDASNHMYLAVVLEALGEIDEAAEHFAQARDLSESEASYHANLSLVYYRMAATGDNEAALARAEEEANAAIAADPNSALAHFALASAYDVKGETAKAIEEFETASNLSSEASLTVMARMRMGMLMQSAGAVFTGTRTVEGTATPSPSP